MSLETKRIKELFGYARTLTKEQGVGVMAGRAAGFFQAAVLRQKKHGICPPSRLWRPSGPTPRRTPTAGQPSVF